jgi:hypothetical protein
MTGRLVRIRTGVFALSAAGTFPFLVWLLPVSRPVLLAGFRLCFITTYSLKSD